MKLLVTGGAGFIGSCIVWKLNKIGIEDIIVVDIPEKITSDCKNLANKKFKDYIERYRLIEYLKSNRLKSEIDVVIHMGACTDTTERDEEYLKKNNLEYSRELAKWSLANNKRFLYASSAATYGAGEKGYSDDDNLTPRLVALNGYGRSKLEFDKWVLENKLQKEFVGFRFFNVFGPNENHKGDMRSMVNKGYQQIKKTDKIRLFKSYKPEYKDGGQKRDFIYVKDAVEVVSYFLDNPDKRGIYNVGTGKAKTWNDLAGAIFEALGLKPNIEYFDMPQVLRDQYQYFTEAELAKLRKAGCNYQFSSLNDAVKDYVGYLEADRYL